MRASEIDSAALTYQRDVMMIWSGPGTLENAAATKLAGPAAPRHGGLYRSLQGCGPGPHAARMLAINAEVQRPAGTS